MPLISIIIPIYKVEPYLCRCVDSVLAQTYKDFELILIDDGSPDRCGAICDKYAIQDKRIHVIHQSNKGLSAARNTGLDCAAGDYICFIDSDDYIELSYLETIIPVMESGADLAAIGYDKFDDNCYSQPYVWNNTKFFVKREDQVKFFIEELMQYNVGWEACFHVYRNDIIKMFQIRFQDTKKVFAEDLLFMICYCAHIERIVCVNNVLYHYYQRIDSIMGKEKSVLNAGRMNELSKEVLSFFIRSKVDNKLLCAFPVIHFYIMLNVISRYKNQNEITYKQFRNLLKADISDFRFFAHNIKKLRKCKQYMEPLFSAYDLEEILDIYEYYADGNMLAFKLKCKRNDLLQHLRK